MKPKARRSVVAGVAFPLLAILYMVVPTALQISQAGATPHQSESAKTAPVSLPLATIDASDLSTYQQFARTGSIPDAPPLIITYHDISDHPTIYGVTPALFASEMAMFAAAGFHTISTSELIAYLNGQALPPKSLMLTFDDGISSALHFADRLLAHYHFTAVDFVITGFVGTHRPYYMTWDELHRLAATGRWELEAHTRNGHVDIPTSATGNWQPFLNHLMWLSGPQRLETPTEFAVRVRTDLQGSLDDLVAHGFPMPTMFAYPFSASSALSTTPASHAAAVAGLDPAVSSLFRVSFSDDAKPHANGAEQLRTSNLNRLDVSGSPSARALFDKILKMTPESVVNRPLTDSVHWTLEPEKANGTVRLNADGTVNLGPRGTGSLGVAYDPDRSAHWSNYAAHVVVDGLDQDGGAGTGVLQVLDNTNDEVDIRVSVEAMTITTHGNNVVARPLPSAAQHTIDAIVTTTSVDVKVDGQAVASLPATGIRGRPPIGGVGLGADRSPSAYPLVTLSDLTVTPLS